MPVYAGHKTEPNCPPNRFCDLSLVDWPQACILGVLDSAHLGHEFGHHGEVLRLLAHCQPSRSRLADLVFVDGVDTKHIESVTLGRHAAVLPLLLLGS